MLKYDATIMMVFYILTSFFLFSIIHPSPLFKTGLLLLFLELFWLKLPLQKKNKELLYVLPYCFNYIIVLGRQAFNTIFHV